MEEFFSLSFLSTSEKVSRDEKFEFKLKICVYAFDSRLDSMFQSPAVQFSLPRYYLAGCIYNKSNSFKGSENSFFLRSI